MADTQKYFLDLVGLTKLWGKIKSTFADKEQTNASIGVLNANVESLDTRIELVDSDVTNLENTVLTIAPREVDYYSEAVELSKSLSVGTNIKVNKSETSVDDSTPSGYSTGIYIVVDSGVIEYISTSDGSTDDSGITELGERVQNLEETVIKSAEIVDEDGKQLGHTYSVNNNVLLVSHDDTFNINSESVKSLTHRAIAAKFRDLENVISGIPKFKISVVDELPDPAKGDVISLYTIYLLRNTPVNSDAVEATENLFTEYIYVESVKDNPETEENESKYVWEKLGEQTLVIDNFVTQNQLNSALSNALSEYSKTVDIEKMIYDADANLKIEILSSVEETYATIETVEELAKDIENVTGDLTKYLTKNEADITYLSKNDAADIYFTKENAENSGWMTENEILVSIQEGAIGETIRITDEQIDEMIAAANN